MNDLSWYGCVIETDRNFKRKLYYFSHSGCNFYLQFISFCVVGVVNSELNMKLTSLAKTASGKSRE